MSYPNTEEEQTTELPEDAPKEWIVNKNGRMIVTDF